MSQLVNSNTTNGAHKDSDFGVLVVDSHQVGCIHPDERVAIIREEVKAEDEGLVEEVAVEIERPDGNRIVRWFRRAVSDPLLLILRRGTEPRKLAFSAALGVSIGIFPICGVTAALSFIAIALLRSNCHPPTLILTNFIVTPLELSLVIPFMRLGEWILNGEPLVLSKDAFWKAITGHASKEILFGFMHALMGWLVALPFMIGALYICLLPLIRYGIKRFGDDLGHVRLPKPSEELADSSLEPLIEVK